MPVLAVAIGFYLPIELSVPILMLTAKAEGKRILVLRVTDTVVQYFYVWFSLEILSQASEGPELVF